MHKFTLADSITVEETSVMKAVASRRISQIEDGTVKGINEMLHSAREVRSEVAKKELDDAIRARELYAMRKDKESKGLA